MEVKILTSIISLISFRKSLTMPEIDDPEYFGRVNIGVIQYKSQQCALINNSFNLENRYSNTGFLSHG